MRVTRPGLWYCHHLKVFLSEPRLRLRNRRVRVAAISCDAWVSCWFQGGNSPVCWLLFIRPSIVMTACYQEPGEKKNKTKKNAWQLCAPYAEAFSLFDSHAAACIYVPLDDVSQWNAPEGVTSWMIRQVHLRWIRCPKNEKDLDESEYSQASELNFFFKQTKCISSSWKSDSWITSLCLVKVPFA